ncbi:hypothetical protein [Pedobacter sp. L105]|uniref:hypothetical protein n=1 Tax=Pedobacter sp. L105 TaxID=1641871 RepID=UPI00131D6E03|nr:hypothetical protein [Pedobacter sp. L105]
MVKSPLTYILITIGSFLIALVWFALYQWVGVTKNNDTSCSEEKTELRIELNSERKRNDNLVNAILVKNGVIVQLSNKADSLNNNNK